MAKKQRLKEPDFGPWWGQEYTKPKDLRRLESSRRQHSRLSERARDARNFDLQRYHLHVLSEQNMRKRILNRKERRALYQYCMTVQPESAYNSFEWGPYGIRGSYTVDGFFEPD